MTKDQAVEFLKSFTSYEDILKYRYNEEFFNLARFKRFLKDYGVLYDKLSAVHIAGSKGKGTTAHLIAEYLKVGGTKIGLFTSPYILDINECFWISGKTISDKEFVGLVDDVRDFLKGWVDKEDGRYVTYFEILFALVLKWFLKNGVSLAVIEVGLGGRLDATNVFTKPLVTVLTRVEKEHTKVLGRTYAKILNEKLGIVKNGVTLVVGPQNGVVLKEIARRRLGVPVVYVEDGGVAGATGTTGAGPNFAVAKTVLQILDKKFDEKKLVAVVSSLRMLGRFQVVGGVVFDMAHTPESAKFLRLKLDEKFPTTRFVFLISLMRDKNVKNFMKNLIFTGAGRGKVEAVCFTSSHPVRGFSGKELSGIVTGGFVVEDPVTAFMSIKRNLKRDQVLVVTGSHFLVSKILKQL